MKRIDYPSLLLSHQFDTIDAIRQHCLSGLNIYIGTNVARAPQRKGDPRPAWTQDSIGKLLW